MKQFKIEENYLLLKKWWETAYAAMSPGGGWDDSVAANKEKGFFNHSANAVT